MKRMQAKGVFALKSGFFENPGTWGGAAFRKSNKNPLQRWEKPLHPAIEMCVLRTKVETPNLGPDVKRVAPDR